MVEYASINGAQLAYRLAGPENAPLIITLHGGRGFGDHRSDFKAYLPLSKTYRLLSFDFRGHGQSSQTEPFTFDQLVNDIESIRQYFVGDAPCIVCGGSFGGFLAQQYAITYPSNVSHLILRGTAASFHHEEAAIRTLEQRASRAPGFSINFLRDKVFGRFDSDLEFRLVMYAAAPLYSEKFDAEAALKSNLETVFYAKSHNDLYSDGEKFFDYTDRLQYIVANTLIVVGEQDWICPPGLSKEIASQIPSSRLEIIAGANHSVHLEKNAEVIELIRQHLS
ncbi:Alpha/beta hydrolase fold-1 [Penicillium verhagenii]|uniref:Alpha/beta hydrolase fold-1 n=1 Tax=Penicillium verhagenii TaxID=1562060 RepID=UPI002545AB8F|nr:Alpha/beta hydrolase fold-1 [Penicillium verhagenii]KAJ5939459.1 Alpha/beta hydrolase fold-1 [Penicillium verhagenii]